MGQQLVTIQPPVGIDFDSDEGRLYNGTATALAIGDVVVVDARQTVNGITGLNTFDPVSGLFTHIRFSSTGIPTAGMVDGSSGWFVVAMEAIASGALGKFKASGDVLANVAAATTFVVGSNLIIQGSGGGQATRFLQVTGGDLNTSITKVIAKAKGATTAGVPAQVLVNFQGLSGFGGAG